ncbi:MAG: DUF559 domain-containing protein [Verrucomicrobiales bacterium]|nr:DUF559 domain-containing protein [Verrucomicrobiales bacterium]
MRGRTSTTNKTKAQARRLRKQPTPSESKLWKLLRDRRFVDFKFRRQHPIGTYVLDFFLSQSQARHRTRRERPWLSRTATTRQKTRSVFSVKRNQSVAILEPQTPR